MRRYVKCGEKGHSIRGQSLPTRMHLGWVHVRTQMAVADTRHTLLRAIIHEDAFRLEENGRTGSRLLGLSDLSRMVNRGRDYDAIRLSPCCRAAYAVGNTELPTKMSLSGRISGLFRKPLPSKWDASSKVGEGDSRSSGNLAMSYFRRKYDSSVALLLVGV